MLLLALIPGLPKFSFFLHGGSMAALAGARARLDSETKPAATAAAATAENDKRQRAGALEVAAQAGRTQPGSGLRAGAAGRQQAGRPVAAARSRAAQASGHRSWASWFRPSTSPTILRSKPREYVVYLRGVEIARWEMRQDCLLAISSEANRRQL